MQTGLASYLPLVIFLGMLFAAAFFGARRQPEWVAGALLVLLLLQELAVRWLTNLAQLPPLEVSIISLWKDVALFGLLLGTGSHVMRSRRSLRVAYDWQATDSVLAGFAVLGVIGVIVTSNKLAGVAALRNYFEPVVMLVVARFATKRGRWTRDLLIAWLGVGALMAGLAIWQGGFWTAHDFVRWGFGTPSSQVGIPAAGPQTFRPPSTTTGPNELALQMVLLMAAAVLLLDKWPVKTRLLTLALVMLYGVALAYTGSRSGFLAMLLALVVVIGMTLTTGEGKVFAGLARKARLRLIGGFLLGATALGAAIVFSGLLSKLVKTMQSLGSQYHTIDTLGAVAYLLKHPGGVGMGLVGPRQGFGFPVQPVFHVEGSYFQLAMDFGVWGLTVFIIFLAVALRAAWSNRRNAGSASERVLVETAIAGWAGASVAFLFLPLMQAFPLMAWLWFLLGLGLRRPEQGSSDLRHIGKHNQDEAMGGAHL